MRLVKLGMANVDSTVGAVRSNVDRMVALAEQLTAEGVTVAVFPEQAIGGYAPEDLVQWRAFVETQLDGLASFAQRTRDSSTAFAVGVTASVGGDLFNCAAMVHRGRVLGLIPKEKLPTYNVFYEARTFSRGVAGLSLACRGIPLGDFVFAFDFGTVALEVCEDIWSPDGPMRRRAYSGAELVCNLSASPYRAGIAGTRHEMIATRAADNQSTVVYANLVGANDGLIFDGGGVINQNGRPVARGARFREGITTAVVDLDRTTRSRREATTWRSDLERFRQTERTVTVICASEPGADRSGLQYPAPAAGTTFFLPSAKRAELSPRDELLDEMFDALALGVAGYFKKTGAFRRIGVAISGGRDSLLTLLVAHRALRLLHPDESDEAFRANAADRLQTFFMPSRFSSQATEDAARTIAEDLGARFEVVSIEEAFARELEATRAMLGGEEPTEITKQNIQARLRGQRMWNWANTSGALFLQTGNMSEKSLGYTTMGGDLEGALSVIANVPKTVVIALLERLSVRLALPGIDATFRTVPGPELAENQSGEAELMPYEVLDACLYLFGAEKLAADELSVALAGVFPDLRREECVRYAEKFARLFTQSIYKWVQAPISLHVGSLDLDRERALQLPVVQRTEWSGERGG